MQSFLTSCKKIINMQQELVEDKAENLLGKLTCPMDNKEKLKRMIVDLVSDGSTRDGRQSVYKILTKSTGKSERTVLEYANRSLAEVTLDEKTREIFEQIGVKGEVTAAKFLKAAAKEVEKSVDEEKKKGTWTG